MSQICVIICCIGYVAGFIGLVTSFAITITSQDKPENERLVYINAALIGLMIIAPTITIYNIYCS